MKFAEAFGKALKAVPGAAAASALGGFVGYVIRNLPVGGGASGGT